ncbi:autophagy-related protein 27 [Dactylonectria estremocensis]|uniref:Autophagy-related protein 27 n=1 Tax=Dactylonectria estremocensis TaxID=1079267 RepID=A0A9P9IWA8_9HYPO|nr:autophagy-related protein 27 [Dactylonectria estremocensis]
MYQPQLSALLLPLLVAPVWGGSTLTCENIRVDGHSFDLSKLGGPHSVVTSRLQSSPPAHFNTTYTLDICKPLKMSGKPKGEECPNGTRVCAITRFLKNDDIDTIVDLNAIAGNLDTAGGTKFDYTVTRLKTSDSTSDSQKEGLRMVLKGGKHHPIGDPSKPPREQKAVVEFICNQNKTGTEGEWDAEDKYTNDKLRLRDDENNKDGDKKEGGGDDKEGDADEEKDHQLKHDDAALIWEGFTSEKDADVLRLTWYTKYACEKRDDNGGDGDNDGENTSWGFFTWFIIITFLGIAAYLVFSSWLNYNRYGARGWDLLPHSDSIRDVPYLLKDWLRRVLNSVQGTGSRGGYSAV